MTLLVNLNRKRELGHKIYNMTPKALLLQYPFLITALNQLPVRLDQERMGTDGEYLYYGLADLIQDYRASEDKLGHNLLHWWQMSERGF